MKALRFSKTIISLILLTATIFIVSGCSIDSPGTSDYVGTIKNEMLEAVNLTRKLKTQQQELDVRKSNDAADTRETLEGLDQVYTNLLHVEAPEGYTDLDTDIKTNAEAALGYISELSSLVNTAETTGDDALYKQESVHIMQEYEICYNELVDMNSQVTKRYRND